MSETSFPRSAKAILLGMFFVVLLVLVFVVLKQRGMSEEVTPSPVTTNTPVTPNNTPPVWSTTPVTSPVVSTTANDSKKMLETLDAQVKAGTLSPEEARQQLEAFNAKNAQPVIVTPAK